MDKKTQSLEAMLLEQMEKSILARLKKNSKESVELNECVKKIILGIKKDYRTVYVLRKKLGFIPFFKKFFGGDI